MTNTPDNQSVYDEIGGREAVDAVVSDFYDRVLADEQLASFFKGFDMAELHTHQVQFISSVAGGPVSYTGSEMREAHAHLDIEKEDFDAVAAYLDGALRENGVRDENVDAIMTEVAALEDPILDR
jgi:hemoglobin